MQLLALCTSDIIWWQFIIVSEIQGCVCFFKSSAVIWKQLSCQGQKNISSVKQYKKTHNEKFGKWRERVRLISRLGWLHGFGYLQAHLNVAGSSPSVRTPLHSPATASPSRCALGKTQGGWVLRPGPLLLDPASGFLLITQISNRCVEAEHFIFIPQCVFFKWQMFFKAKKKKNISLYSSPLKHTAKGMNTCLQRGISFCHLNKELSQWSQNRKPFVTIWDPY